MSTLAALRAVWAEGFRRNFLPALVLQGFAVAILALYFFVPAARPLFEAVAEAKARHGVAFGMATTAFFGGFIPALVLLHRGRIPVGQRRAQMVFFVLFWAVQGFILDTFYTKQAAWFGTGNDPLTLLKKVLVDQGPYNLLWGTPICVLCYAWKDAGFSWRRLRPSLNPADLGMRLAAVQTTSWTVWIPAVTLLYCLPSALQLPMNNLILCFYTLVLNFVSRGRKD